MTTCYQSRGRRFANSACSELDHQSGTQTIPFRLPLLRPRASSDLQQSPRMFWPSPRWKGPSLVRAKRGRIWVENAAGYRKSCTLGGSARGTQLPPKAHECRCRQTIIHPKSMGRGAVVAERMPASTYLESVFHSSDEPGVGLQFVLQTSTISLLLALDFDLRCVLHRIICGVYRRKHATCRSTVPVSQSKRCVGHDVNCAHLSHSVAAKFARI